jgi:hypothetical protein
LRGGRLGVRGCAVACGGRFHARGYDTYAPQSHDRNFVSLGAGAALTLNVGVADLRAGLSAGVPLFREAFEFAPEIFHRVRPVAVTVGVGAEIKRP